MNRTLSSFDIYTIVSEMQNYIDSFVEQIYQLSRDELLIKIKKKNEKKTIYVKNSELFCLTNKKFSVPQKPTAFAMTLRKYLTNGKISEISQHEFDRIIKIKISKKEGDYSLIFELFSKGNIILLNPDSIILLPLISQTWSHRTIRSKEKYMPPPAQINPFKLSFKQYRDILKKSKKDLIRTLALDINLGGLYSEEICHRLNIQKNIKVSTLDEETIKKIFDEIRNLLDVFLNKKFTPIAVKENEDTIDVLPIKLTILLDKEYIEIENFILNLQELIGVSKKDIEQTSKNEEKIEKLQRQLERQKESVKEFQEKILQKKIEGDVIYLNFSIVQDILNQISDVLKQKQKDEGIGIINNSKIVKNFDPTSNELTVLLNDENRNIFTVDLDFRKTVSENAELAYNKSKKFQEKLRGAKEAIENTKNEIEKTRQEKQYDDKKPIQETKHFWFESYRWFISTEGNVIVAGKDAKTNDIVVKKYLDQGDRYVHADVHGAPSCIVKSKNIFGKDIPITEKTLEEACIFASSFSKAWNQYGEANAYWVLPEQVSKTPQSGEFLPKGAFVIRGKRNYNRCKLELAIGKISIDNIEKITCGPVDSIASQSKIYIIIEPGGIKKSTFANKLSKIFNTSVDTILKILPPGNIRIAKTVGIELK